MKKTHAAVAALTALLAALLTAVVPTTAAQAYPDPACNLTVSSTSLQGGKQLKVTVRSDTEAALSATFRGQTKTASAARVLEAVFSTPKVDRPTKAEVVASCDGTTRSTTITLLPAGADGVGDGDGNGTDDNASGLAGILPDTGGTSFWLLLLGILLVLAGVTVAVRRRQA